MELSSEVGKLGYAGIKMERPPTSPDIRRKKRDMKRLPLLLPPELWEDLKAAARFHTRMWKLTGRPETVSRNDWIEDSLRWALAAYWKDKGGKPASPEDFEAKAGAYAAKVREEEAAKQSDGH